MEPDLINTIITNTIRAEMMHRERILEDFVTSGAMVNELSCSMRRRVTPYGELVRGPNGSIVMTLPREEWWVT